MKPPPTTLIFFDGVCNLCNFWVDWLLRIDRRAILQFAPLQGQTARARLGSEATQLATLVVIQGDKILRASDAVIAIGLALGGIHRWGAKLLRLIPRWLRDQAYLIIARHRYGWFGQRSSCRLPTDAERQRFLD